MGGAGGVPPKEFVGGGGVNGGSPTSFDIPANELEAARPQVYKNVYSHKICHNSLLFHTSKNIILVRNFPIFAILDCRRRRTTASAGVSHVTRRT